MINIYPTVYQHAKLWSSIVDESIREGFFRTDRVIQEGLRQITNMMLIPTPKDETIIKIIDLMEKQALRLQGPSNIQNYIKDIRALAKEAPFGNVTQIYPRVEALRLAGYEDDKVYPHNREEIEQLIEAKRSLAQIQQVFDFCMRVQKIKTENPTQDQISRLRWQIQGLKIDDFQALQEADRFLQEWKEPQKPSEPSPIILPAPKSPSLIERIWNAIRSFFFSFHFLAK